MMRRFAGCPRILSALGQAHTAEGFCLMTQFAGAGDLDRHITPARCATSSCAPALLPLPCSHQSPRVLPVLARPCVPAQAPATAEVSCALCWPAPCMPARADGQQ
jgi:hypothetical protein